MGIGEEGLPEIEGCFCGIAVGFSGQIRLALRGVAGSRIAPLEALSVVLIEASADCLFFLAEDFGVGVGDGDAEEFEVGVEPEVPIGAVGLDDEVAEVLGTAVQRRVVVALELDVDLGGGIAAWYEDGKAGADEVAAIAGGTLLAGGCEVSPEQNFAGDEEIVVENKCLWRKKEGVIGGFAVFG